MDNKNNHIKPIVEPNIENWNRPEQLVLLRNWRMWGATFEQIAERIGISTTTLSEWRKKSPSIDSALINSTEICDAFAEETLYGRVLDGNMEAIKFWLNARQAERWNPTTYYTRESLKLDNEMKRLKIKELEVESLKNKKSSYVGIPADMIAPPFIMLHHDIAQRNHKEYILPGGRGSTKSSFVSLEVINYLEKNPESHAVICRMVADTMRTSVFTQIQWAIDMLGLSKEYKTTLTPLEITKRSTGQKIYFRGADDPGKFKSLAVPFGHVGVLWFEEFDQFKGSEFIRKIEQSCIRGTDYAVNFKSFNPPRSKNNFANEYTKEKEEKDKNCLVTWSNYTEVPESWLGRPFIEDAEYLKETNPHAYENEYLGVANGSGGNVFENIEVREITDEEIEHFDKVGNGVDWGWYPDKYAFVRVQYNKAQHELIFWDEEYLNKTSNEDTANILKEKHGITEKDLIVCDSAEPKSIAEYINHGLYARGAVKGQGSIEHGMKWLASLKLVFDEKRTPNALREFQDYEYERDDNGEILSGYPDENNHLIDATRYATEQFQRREAQIKV